MVDFSNVISVINLLSGVKSIARKFDNSERIWVRVKEKSGATTSKIYCYNLSGSLIASSGNITTTKGNHDQFFAMDDRCWIFTSTGTAPIYVYMILGSSINRISQTSKIGSWPSSSGFAWKVGNEIHFSTSTNTSIETPIDCNITTGTVLRTENSSQRVLSQYIHYTGSSLEGLFWNHNTTSTPLKHTSYTVQTSASGSKTIPSSPVLEDGYYCWLFPKFNYVDTSDDYKVNLFAMVYSSGTTEANKLTNIAQCNSEGIYRGSVIIPNDVNSFCPSRWGLLHDGINYYSYNAATGNIELVCNTEKIATRAEAKLISGIGNTSVNPNKAILKSELHDFGCDTVLGTSYAYDLCVKLSDLVKLDIGFTVNSYLEYSGEYASLVGLECGVSFGNYKYGNYIQYKDYGYLLLSPLNGANQSNQTIILTEKERKDIVNNCSYISISIKGTMWALYIGGDLGHIDVILRLRNSSSPIISHSLSLGTPASISGDKAYYNISTGSSKEFSPSEDAQYTLEIYVYTSA